MQTLTLTCDQANSSLNSGRTSDYYGCLTGKTWENRTHVGSSSRKEFDCVSGEFSGWRSSTRLARCWAWRISFWLWTRQIFAEFWWLQAAMSYGVKRCLVLRTWAGTVAPWRSGYLQRDQCRCSGQCQHALEPSIDRPPHLPGFFVGIFELHCDSSDFQPTTHRHSAFDSTAATRDERRKITCWFCVEAEEIAGDYATTMPQDSFLRMSKQFWDPGGGLLWWLSLRYADCMMSLQIAVVPQVQHGSVVPEFLNLLGCSGFSSLFRHIGAAWFTCQRLVANLAGLCPIVRWVSSSWKSYPDSSSLSPPTDAMQHEPTPIFATQFQTHLTTQVTVTNAAQNLSARVPVE